MKYIIVKLIFLFLFLGCRPEEKELPGKPGKVSDATNNIRHYLERVSGEITGNALRGIQSTDDWDKKRPEKQRQMERMLSLVDMPMEGPRPALNVQVTGVLQKEGYRIEKLYYESLPGLYVPANLYVPDDLPEKAPAILYLCGHARNQKVHYQAHARKFAQLGFVCLIVETIQYGEVWGEHWGCYARGWFHWYSRGYTPAGVEVWNALRGFDLLEGREEVDAGNMGVTGISGGGAQAWFMAAVDTRVKAVAPVCGASTIEAQVTTRTLDGHCDCMMCINTWGWSIPEMGALIAPRPLLIAQADRDGLNKVESVRDIYQSLIRFYELYGAVENISYIETPGGHSYHPASRKMINAFFMDHLMDETVTPDEAGDVDESPGAQASEEELMVFVNGPLTDDITKTIQDSFINLPELPVLEDKEALIRHRDSVRAFLQNNTFNAFPQTSPDFDSVLVFRTRDRAPYGAKIFSRV